MIPINPYPKSFRRGNIFRMRQALQKQEIRIAFLGGTDLYANINYDDFYDKVKKELMEKNDSYHFNENEKPSVEILNMEYSGMTSLGGLFHLESLIDWNPDIVFLDFSMEDPGEKIHEESSEGLIRTLLEKGIAVSLILSCSKKGLGNAGHQKYLSLYYNLPVLDLSFALHNDIENERYLEIDIFNEDRTFTKKGHEILVDYFTRFIEMIVHVLPDETYELPEKPCFLGSLQHFQQHKIAISPRTKEGSILFDKKLTYNMFFLQFDPDPEPNNASLEIYVDKKLVRNLGVHSILSSQKKIELFIDGHPEPEKHHIQIRTSRLQRRVNWTYASLHLQLGLGSQEPFTTADKT
ncbi:MAG: SGNH/GDSL hydrolase family protein [Eubacterium sp.]